MSGSLWYVAVFSIAVGVAMVGLWSVLLATRQVPEIDEGRIDIWFHVAAEVLTGLLLVGSASAASPIPTAKGSAISASWHSAASSTA